MKRDINTLSLLNEISELVYVSDPETYELLFVNQTGCQTLHLENYKHKKCYEVLQGKTSPCEFCTNDRLCHWIILSLSKKCLPIEGFVNSQV